MKISNAFQGGMAERGGKRAGAGRPKGSSNRATTEQKMRLSELAKQYAGVAIKTLADIAENGQCERARIAAACAVLDRAYGKPREAGFTQYQKPSPLDDLLGE